MRRLTAALAASGVAALMLTGAGAARPLPSATMTACFNQQGSIVATVTWSGGRVTNGTFVASDFDGIVTSSIVQWDLPHGERSGTQSAQLGPDLGYELVEVRLYAGKSQVVNSHFDVSAMTSC
jgi:hypothetical protein